MKNTYAKPQIEHFCSACRAVEGSGEKTQMWAPEIPNGPIICTSPGYEADE